MHKCLFSLLIFISFSSFISTLAAQEEWKEIANGKPSDSGTDGVLESNRYSSPSCL